MGSQVSEWAKALASGGPVPTNEAQPGFYLAKLHGKMLPARIFYYGARDEDGELIEDERLRCTIGGVECDVEESWDLCAKRPITQAEFDDRTAEMHYANTEHF